LLLSLLHEQLSSAKKLWNKEIKISRQIRKKKRKRKRKDNRGDKER
jgi:hypothetical protein